MLEKSVGKIPPFFADMHIHMLQGVDDGARDEIAAMDMLRMAYGDGTRIFILTPHFHGGYMQTKPEAIEKAYKSFKKIAEEKYPDVRIHLGSEIYYFDSVIEWLDEKKINTMAGSRYVLLEFSNNVTERELKSAVRQLIVSDYYPVLAHINRYEELVKNIDIVYELINLGAYTQINTEAITGTMGHKIKSFAKKLIKNGAVHFIASDAHSIRTRNPILSDSFKYVCQKFGEETAQALFYKNTIHVIENTII